MQVGGRMYKLQDPCGAVGSRGALGFRQFDNARGHDSAHACDPQGGPGPHATTFKIIRTS